MTTDRVISSFALPRHLGGHRVVFDGNDPPQPPPPPPPPPPAPPPPAAHPAPPPPPRASTDDPAALRAEAAAYRVDARTAREAEAAARAEVERVRTESAQQVAAANTAAQQTTQVFKNRQATAELKAAAIAEGLVDADLLPLIDKSKIVVADDGSVTGVTEAVAEFKAKKPDYFRTGGGQPSPPRRTGDPIPPPPPSPGGPQPQAVAAIPKGQEGKKAYGDAKHAALAALK